MALEVHLKALQLPGVRKARLQFRGVHYYSRSLRTSDTDEMLLMDEKFEWLLASPLGIDEGLYVEAWVGSRWRGGRGRALLPLGDVAANPGHPHKIQTNLFDDRGRHINGSVTVEVQYTSPEMFPSFHCDEYDAGQSEDELLASGDSGQSRSESPDVTYRRGGYKRTSALKSVRNLMRFASRSRRTSESDIEGGHLVMATHPAAPAPTLTSANEELPSPDKESIDSALDQHTPIRRPLSNVHANAESKLKAQDFQVCITILEARQLAGLNMDPVVCVQLGQHKKYTSVKESTNCPYYNEYFVFDFHMPPAMLFDKIITLSVMQARNMLRPHKLLGSFRLDVATVWAQPDHQFYHKWAVLTDPSDMWSGAKGYLKCDISVIGKGDTVKIPPKSDKDEDDIEANLLLPDGVPSERQRARFVVKIHKADGLPKMNLDLVANVKKVLTGESEDLVDPFVQVCFGGVTGATSVKKNCYNPVWNEQVVFTDLFPPLCQRVRIRLMDQASVKPTVIGTHHIDLKTISNDGERGFLPTFGPAYVYLYGSQRDYSLLDEHSALNAGLGEGVSYRARILVSIRTEVKESVEAPRAVEVEGCEPAPELCSGKEEDFFLFSSIFDATMIEKKLAEKPISFELSVGNFGNTIDGYNHSAKHATEGQEMERSNQSMTPMTRALSHDKTHYFLPYWDRKPCLHVYSSWPDHCRRMYLSNIIERIANSYEEALKEIGEGNGFEECSSKLREALTALHNDCLKFSQMKASPSLTSTCFMTELDKKRADLVHRELESIGAKSRHLKALVTRNSFKERLKTAQAFLARLKFLIEDPQGGLPDVVIWAVGGGKRLAYQRIPARHLIYSPVAEEMGKLCGKTHTMFLKLPGKRAEGSSGWGIPMKLVWYVWMGPAALRKLFSSGLPAGANLSPDSINPPAVLNYTEQHSFQLRSYIYQARSLIGSDASGLSDPFARIIADEYCRNTKVIDETLSPTWDQTLVFNDICLFGPIDQIKLDALTIIIEIFDQDKVGKSEFIGRAMAKPRVKTLQDEYSKPDFPPSLEWYELVRGTDKAGELLATFELLETSRGDSGEPVLTSDVPPLPPTLYDDIIPVPDLIRPTLATYRIEVLFWGLRDLKRVHFLAVDKPRVDIECAGNILSSSIIQNAQKNPNFSCAIKFLDVELPEQELYRPPLTIRVVDCRSFGRFTLVGTHMINSIHKYMIGDRSGADKPEKTKRITIKMDSDTDNKQETTFNDAKANGNDDKENFPLLKRENPFSLSYGTGLLTKKSSKAEERKKKRIVQEEDDDDECSKDWWTKYFASVETMIEESNENNSSDVFSNKQQTVEDCKNEPEYNNYAGGVKRRKLKTVASTSKAAVAFSHIPDKKRCLPYEALCKVYPNELESQPAFEDFKEWLLTFDLYRGKKCINESEDESRVVGAFKGAIKVYQWPPPKSSEAIRQLGFDPHFGFFQSLPSNEPIRVLVRVYIIKANDLHPMDLNGKADPYVVLQMGPKKISDKDNYISKQLNPVFGKCFEVEATFPRDSILTVRIQDWDLVGSDDIIGETKIDIENRFYSRHRATCGLPRQYEEEGLNRWRDAQKPTQILAKLCKDYKLDPPIYEFGRVRIGKQVFDIDDDETLEPIEKCKKTDERLALKVLHRWSEMPRVGCMLVPEHIETRPLYSPDKPGIERGKLEMWVDMFPLDMPPPGPPIDISPRKPRSYELRIIIWNTDDVVLEDDAFFTGEKMSDIYVKGWLKGNEDCQSTDIHYRSLTGEGNFNWRFIFPFDYLVAEEKIVITKKESLFSWDETESKIPARLELQVWDADHFSADDFLGAITLDLNRFPRGAKSSKLCTLNMLQMDGSVPMVNIFKQKRVKGWWPFYTKKDNEEMELTGKVEAEIHLLTKEEAEKNPAGLGRNEPEPLDKPNRPDASFMWFLNPLKSIRYIIWHNYKWKVLKAIAVMGLVVLMLLFLYAFPGYTVKKFLGA